MCMEPQVIHEGNRNAEDSSEDREDSVMWRLSSGQQLLHSPKTNKILRRNTQFFGTPKNFLKTLFSFLHNPFQTDEDEASIPGLPFFRAVRYVTGDTREEEPAGKGNGVLFDVPRSS